MSKPHTAENSESELAAEGAADSNPLLSQSEIPDKLYFRIGEVARLAGIKPYVLRFWETEFPSLGPKKSGTGHRLYRRKDVQLVFDIKHLLYEKRFTIAGARKHLEGRGKVEPPPPKDAAKTKSSTRRQKPKVQAGLFDVPPSALADIQKELTEILNILK